MIFINRWDWARADQEIARAIELDPNYAEAWHFRSKIYAVLGRNEEAVAVQKKAMELDPFERPFRDGAYLLPRAPVRLCYQRSSPAT